MKIHILFRDKRSLRDFRGIISQTIESHLVTKDVPEIVQPKPGLIWASLLALIIIPYMIIQPLPKISPGQAPPRLPQPGTSNGGGLPSDLANAALGEALALVPDGLEPVAVFPPFMDSRIVPAVGVIFSENPQNEIRRRRLRRKQLRRHRRSSEEDEESSWSKVKSRLWDFLGSLEDNLVCMKPRLERHFGSRKARALLDSVDDCFPDEEEPKYGFRMRVFLKTDEECSLRHDCLSHLNVTTKYQRFDDYNPEVKAEFSPECKIKNICG